MIRSYGPCEETASNPIFTQDAVSRRVIERFSTVWPLDIPYETPWIHLKRYRAQAGSIVTDPGNGFSPATVDRFLAVYDAGLLAGFDDLFFFLSDDKVSEPFRGVLEHVGSIGWQHGSAIRQWWATYSRLVDAWLGKGGV